MSGASSRMLTLLSLLQTRRDWPGHVLAERLGVTSRTIRRDVDRLRGLGYRIQAAKGPDGGYRLAAGSELPPLLFDDEQAVAIAVALQHAPSSGVEIEEASARALATVRQVMPSRLRHRIDGVQFTDVASPTRVNPEVLEEVSAAVRSHMTLRFDYGGAAVLPRRTHPHGVVARQGRWYLVAWDLDHDDWRIYRLDRMSPQDPYGAGFHPTARTDRRRQHVPCCPVQGLGPRGPLAMHRPVRDLAASRRAAAVGQRRADRRAHRQVCARDSRVLVMGRTDRLHPAIRRALPDHRTPGPHHGRRLARGPTARLDAFEKTPDGSDPR